MAEHLHDKPRNRRSWARRILRRPGVLLSHPFGLLTGRWRALPDFLVIGAMKAGSTALYDYIIQHPQVVPPFKKELHYFDRHLHRGETWYRSRFPLQRNVRPPRITGESSPTYLPLPHAPRLIHALVPDARLVAVLRNPTQRAISHYFHQVAKRTETRPILQAMRDEPAVIAPHLERMARDERYFHWEYANASYLHHGYYVDHLARYHEHFGRDRLLVVTSDELADDTTATMRRVYAFLGVDADFVTPNRSPRNVGDNKQPIAAEVTAFLDDHFRPYNARLRAYLGRDLGW